MSDFKSAGDQSSGLYSSNFVNHFVNHNQNVVNSGNWCYDPVGEVRPHHHGFSKTVKGHSQNSTTMGEVHMCTVYWVNSDLGLVRYFM